MVSLIAQGVQVAQGRENSREFLTDPLLTVAAFMLVAVCVLWILFSRLISFNLRRRARTTRMYEDRIAAGMTPEEIKEADARRHHRLRKQKAEADGDLEDGPDAVDEDEPSHSM